MRTLGPSEQPYEILEALERREAMQRALEAASAATAKPAAAAAAATTTTAATADTTPDFPEVAIASATEDWESAASHARRFSLTPPVDAGIVRQRSDSAFSGVEDFGVGAAPAMGRGLVRRRTIAHLPGPASESATLGAAISVAGSAGPSSNEFVALPGSKAAPMEESLGLLPGADLLARVSRTSPFVSAAIGRLTQEMCESRESFCTLGSVQWLLKDSRPGAMPLEEEDGYMSGERSSDDGMPSPLAGLDSTVFQGADEFSNGPFGSDLPDSERLLSVQDFRLVMEEYGPRQSSRSGLLLLRSSTDPNVWRKRLVVLTDRLWCLRLRPPFKARVINLAEGGVREAPRNHKAPFSFEIHTQRRVFHVR